MYIITIEKVEEVTTIERGKWVTLEKRPYTDEELKEANSLWRERPENPITALKEVTGYGPPYEQTKTVQVEVYKQTVESLDLPTVIRAINGLE